VIKLSFYFCFYNTTSLVFFKDGRSKFASISWHRCDGLSIGKDYYIYDRFHPPEQMKEVNAFVRFKSDII